jgi:hypothetical protein
MRDERKPSVIFHLSSFIFSARSRCEAIFSRIQTDSGSKSWVVCDPRLSHDGSHRARQPNRDRHGGANSAPDLHARSADSTAAPNHRASAAHRSPYARANPAPPAHARALTQARRTDTCAANARSLREL